jgi:hypothetical protein
MHMRQFIFAHDYHGWIKFWRLFWSDLEAYMRVLCNVLRWWKVCAHILCLCMVNFQQHLIHSFYPDHFLVLACIACDIVVIWKSTYLSSISSPAANMLSLMCGSYYQCQGWTILVMFILTDNTITIWLNIDTYWIWYDYIT